MFVSWVGTVPLAALSLSVPVFYLALALAKGIGVGSTTLMSRYRGEGDAAKADSISRYSLTLMILVMSPMLILTLPGPCRTIFSLLGAEGEVKMVVHDYALWLCLGFPFMGYAFLCESVFMSHGDSMTPMKGMILGNIINLVLDPILIFWAGLGLAGASMASLLGWAFTGLYMRHRLAKEGFACPALTWEREMFPFWRAIWGLGYLIALSMIVIPISFGTMNWLLARAGAAPLGAWNLMSRVELMIALPFMGITNALVPFIGFNLGKKDFGRILEGIRFSLVMEIVGMAVFSLLFISFAKEIMEMFRPDGDVLRWSSYALRASATAYVLYSFELTLLGSAQGLGRPLYSLLSTGMRQIGLRLPLAFCLSSLWGVKGIYWSHPMSLMLGGLFSLVLLRILVRKAGICGHLSLFFHENKPLKTTR